MCSYAVGRALYGSRSVRPGGHCPTSLRTGTTWRHAAVQIVPVWATALGRYAAFKIQPTLNVGRLNGPLTTDFATGPVRTGR